MKLLFKCPVCSTDLQLKAADSVGPCPTCQNTLQVEIQIAALEPALNVERTERKVTNWRCSGTPHGTSSFPARA